MASFNWQLDWAGKSLGTPTEITSSVAVNPTAEDMDRGIARFQAKIDAGAHFVMTQPIFDLAQGEEFLRCGGKLRPVPLMIGLWPLARYGLARRLPYTVSGERTARPRRVASVCRV